MDEIKDRIKGFRRVAVNKLVPHPENWRTHSDGQRKALSTALESIGWADAIVARELEDGTYQILDGHLRAESAHGKVPILIVDLDDNESRMLLATHDSIGAMAGTDSEMLQTLIDSIDCESATMRELLDEMSVSFGCEAIDPPTGDIIGEVPDDNYREQYGVIVICESEREQERIFNELKDAGYQCRVVTT